MVCGLCLAQGVPCALAWGHCLSWDPGVAVAAGRGQLRTLVL